MSIPYEGRSVADLTTGVTNAYSIAGEMAKDNRAEFPDLKFCDLLGAWHHLTMLISALTNDLFVDGGRLMDRRCRDLPASNMAT
jgi:hypothetical protein